MPKLEFSAPFCTHLNRVAEEFPSGLERDFAQHFSVNFLEFWKQALGSTPSASTPTYSSVAATATAAAIATVSPIRSSTTSSVYPPPLPTATHRQGQRAPPPPPPREDLRVFVRLDADAPARNHIGYAIRAHVASKTGLELNKAPQVVQVNTGWAIRAVDKTTRDLLLERQAEWADDLGASAGQASQKWHTYAVNNCPRRLTDLYGNEIDYDTAVRDEINHQTGLTPVSIRTPRRDNERLPYKTLIISFLQPTKRPCKLANCPARPKKVRGLYHRLSREQRSVVRQMGSQLFQQHQAVQQRQQSQATPNEHIATEPATEQQRAPVAVMELLQNPVNPLDLTNPLGLHLASSTDDIPDATQDPETGTRDSISATSADFT
ncbi:hypothetical protein MANI_110385 [Metarhizium anisopliae]|nr:hypothetical protein MANI_110385 [Metarhizium anisopliae]